MRKIKLIALSLLFINATYVPSKKTIESDSILGHWISPKKDVIVKCFKKNNLFYSKVIWFKKYLDHSPDDPNAIPEKEWLGTVVMYNFKFENNEWVNGGILNLKDGKRHTAYIQMEQYNALKLVGFMYFRVFSESVVFKRFTGEIPKQH